MSADQSNASALAEATRVLALIATQGGDIVEPWSAEMARQALIRIENKDTGNVAACCQKSVTESCR